MCKFELQFSVKSTKRGIYLSIMFAFPLFQEPAKLSVFMSIGETQVILSVTIGSQLTESLLFDLRTFSSFIWEF